MTSTHDLSPVAGWWRGATSPGASRLAAPGDRQAERIARDQDRQAFWDVGARGGVAEGPPPDADAQAAVDAALALVAQTPCELALIPLEDLLGLEDAPNLPGVVEVHPNWRRRLPETSETLFSHPASPSAWRGSTPRDPNDPHRHLPRPVPRRLHLRRRGEPGALLGQAGDQPPLRLADRHGAARLDPRLRRRRSDDDQSGPGRRGRFSGPWSRPCAREGSGGGSRHRPQPCRRRRRRQRLVAGRPRERPGQRLCPLSSTSTGARPIPTLAGKVLAPFLGAPYGQALAAGETCAGRRAATRGRLSSPRPRRPPLSAAARGL
jgi:hypothetical protein